MDDPLRVVREPQDHVVVLAAVEFGPKQLLPVQELPGEDAEMADVVVGPQIVRGVVRLKVHGQHAVDVVPLEGGLIAIQIIRILFIDSPHILVERAGVEQVVLVQQA